jgi:hypothetical protein
VVMVVPIDTEIDEAQNVAEEHGDQRQQRLDAFAVGHLHLQHHDGDDDGDHAVAESFKPVLWHGNVATVLAPISFEVSTQKLCFTKPNTSDFHQEFFIDF